MGKEELIDDLENVEGMRRNAILNQVNNVIEDLKRGEYDIGEGEE